MTQATGSEAIAAEGQVFAERYRIGELIGRGGMGAVYRALDLELGEDIALKVLTIDPEQRPDVAARFRKEVKLARRVTHPNVARVYDIGENAGRLFLTMELIDGVSLFTRLAQRRCLPPAEAAGLARSVALGLEAAHAAGVVHRDLKPGNILIASSGRVVLTDFGLARSLVDEASVTTSIVGTPSYMAPEQVTGGMVDARTDIYSLGLVLFEMLCARRLRFGEKDPVASLRACAVPSALAALVARCIELAPDARPGSMHEVAEQLGAILSGLAAAPPQAHAAAGQRQQAIAVLPFLFRGSSEGEYLGDAVSDELADVLSQNRGLRVVGSAATARFRDARDPQVVGRELGVSAVIDGAVQLAGGRGRLSVRLLDASTRAQRWSGHHESSVEDLLAFQVGASRRIAEQLRLELLTMAYGDDAPPEAVEHYHAARRGLQRLNRQALVEAASSFTQCTELAPGFAPAYAGHAMACLRCWYLDIDASVNPTVDWRRAASESIERALANAPDLAESHLAAAMFALHHADYVAARRSLLRSLTLAPTCGEANELLGVLECEAGYGDAGIERLKLADTVDEGLPYTLIFQARYYALHGRHAECDAAIDELWRREGPIPSLVSMHAIRIAAWRGDRGALARWAHGAQPVGAEDREVVTEYAQAMLGELDSRELVQRHKVPLATSRSARQITVLRQSLAEVYAARGELDEARRQLVLASAALLDTDWLERCPLLEPLRERPDVAEARRQVADRAERFWNA